MGSFYRLQIYCDDEQKILIDNLLGNSNDTSSVGWGLIIEEDSLKFRTALYHFLDLIKYKLLLLEEIGVSVDMITFWYMYEYEQQCNMEFGPQLMKQMGDLGISLCVSCWEK